MYSFGIFGSDARMKYLCASLVRDGYAASMLEGDVRLFVAGKDVIVLPIGNDCENVLSLCRGKTVFGGFVGKAPEYDGVRVLNYAENDYFKARNALPTAEGAILLAMKQTDAVIAESHAVVVGFGNIGRCLVDLLLSLGAFVTVAARSERDRAQAENLGAAACDISALSHIRADVIYNTVPAAVIDKSVIDAMDEKTLIIDLASAPGGVDFAAAAAKGVTAVHELGVPGKYAPRTAGQILKSTIISMLREV